MFGMNDPAQTLMQLENYIRDGRLEMSEVMATQFTDMFLRNKKRDAQDQIMLVRGLQILCDVLVSRNKFSLAASAAKTLLRERKKTTRENTIIGNYYQDLQRSGKCYALVNKPRKAKSFFTKAYKQSGGCIVTALEAVVSLPEDKKMSALFLDSLAGAGSVARSGSTFILQPENLPQIDLSKVLAALNLPIYQNNPEAKQLIDTFAGQIRAIESGEMAANQKLQNALDSLQPKHDYYEYS